MFDFAEHWDTRFLPKTPKDDFGTIWQMKLAAKVKDPTSGIYPFAIQSQKVNLTNSTQSILTRVQGVRFC